ncbi:50S ribosomal protein L23 [Eubacteriales bacterium OttesenSCG-928-N14]|nr:50S ribosomal protein L23 [Eubacteriales bacterium OttesenSCG-928-N14]
MKSPYDVIIKPVLTEKSYDDIGNRKYTFIVHPDANRTEIKQAVEEAFGVTVQKVNVLNQLGKIKRQGRTQGRTSSYKKAYVQLTAGSKPIDAFEGMAQ